MKYFIYTSGCKSNLYDSFIIDHKLQEAGFTPSDSEDADIVVINACTVTENAEKDTKRVILRTRRRNRKAKVILAGCHPQVYPEKNFGAELVLGQNEKFNIVDYIEKVGVFVGELENDGYFKDKSYGFSFEPRTRFFLKIQDGCDKLCSYCIVPFARGKPKSMPVEEIIKIMRDLKKEGTKEVVLSGIEIASYYDPVPRLDFKGLLRLLEKSETPERIRLSSVDPLYIDSEFIGILSSSKKLARSLHIPLQSGCNSILEKMGRRYKAEEVKDVIEELKFKIEDIGIGLDVIVGFPGEGESEFNETVRFIESLGIYYLHIFPFSPREKTLASKMTGFVEDSVKRKRVHVLKEIDKRNRLLFYEKYIGQVLKILPEKKIYQGGYMKGFSDNYIPVFLPHELDLVNHFIDVLITDVKGGRVFGRRTD